MMTEAQARDKWCQETAGENSCNCRASQCMAWRWTLNPSTEPKRAADMGGGRGYCGKAGQP